MMTQRSFYLLFIFSSIALFLWQCHLYPTLNRDGVTYLQGAALYLSGGVKATVALGDQARWPFYSVLIAEVSRWSSLSLLTSAYALDLVFICLSGLFFLLILQTCSRQTVMLWMGALVWLLWHGYSKWWPQIVRDHGGLSFFLISLYCLLQFARYRTFLWAMLWSLALGIATLFRFEAAIYWCLLPWVFCLAMNAPFSLRLRCFFQLTSLFGLMCFVMLVLFLTEYISLDSLRFRYIADSALDYVAIMQHAYDMYAAHYSDRAPWMIVLRLLWEAIRSFTNVLTFLGLFALMVYYKVRKDINQTLCSPVMIAYLAVSFFVPIAFYLQNFFLNARYILSLCVCLLLLATPALVYLVQHRTQHWWTRFACMGLVLVLLCNTVATLHHFGHAPRNEREAGYWVRDCLSGRKVFTNAKRVFFYMTDDPAQYAFREIRAQFLVPFLTEHCQIKSYDVLVLAGPRSVLDHVYVELHALHMVGPVMKTFSLSRGAIVIVLPVTANC